MAQIQPPVAPSTSSASASQVDTAVEVFKALLEITTITKASFLPGGSSGISEQDPSLLVPSCATAWGPTPQAQRTTGPPRTGHEASFELTPLADLLLETSHRSVSQLSKRSGSQTLALSSTNEVLSTSPLAFTAPEVQHTSYSPDGARSAVFRSIKPEGKEKKLLVEIWDVLAGVKEEELEVQKEHGDWYFDGAFSSSNVQGVRS